MRILLQSSLICVLLLIGCARHLPTAEEYQRVVLVLHDGYDNRSFSGRWIRLHADGRYMDIFYTDVVSQERVKRGVYRMDAERTHLTLTSKNGDPEHLYRVDHGDEKFWIHEKDLGRMPGPDEFWLKEVSGWLKVPRRLRF